MSLGRKIEKGLDFFRISLGGAMLGAVTSSVLGSYAGMGNSITRDLIWAIVGFASFLLILVYESRKEMRTDREVKGTRYARASD